MLYCLPDEGLIDLDFEHLIGQLQLAHDFIHQIFYFDLSHFD